MTARPEFPKYCLSQRRVTYLRPLWDGPALRAYR